MNPSSSIAAEPTYWQDVRPVLRKHCTVCHRESKIKETEVSAGLALDTLANIRTTGKTPAVVAGKPEQSLLVSLLTTKDVKRRMPLDADPLPAEAADVLKKWVAAGMPEGVKPADDTPTVGVNPTARPGRKLPVSFTTTAVLPKAGPLALTLPVGPLPPVAAVALSPNGKLLAAGSYGRVTVWNVTAAKPVKVITTILGAVNDLKFSPDGKLLAVAGGQPSARGDLRLFETKDWKLTETLGGHLDTVSSVSFSPDGTKLASASFDKTARLWDVKTGKVLHTFTGHSDFVYAVAFSPKGDWYATASKDRTSRVIDVKTGQSKLTFSGMNDEVVSVTVRPDGAQVVTSGFEPQLYWWDATTGERVRREGGHGTATHELAAGGGLVISGGADKTLKTWDPATGKVKTTSTAESVVFAAAGDKDRLAAGCADGTVRVFDAKTGKLRLTLWSGAGAGDLGAWLAVAPDGYFAASAELATAAGWSAGGKPVADPKAVAKLNDPNLAAKAGRGETVPAFAGK